MESVIVKSISLGDDELRTAVRSVSSKGQHSEATIFQSVGSGEMLTEKIVSFWSSDDNLMTDDCQSYKADEDGAAIKLQKVYKSFRTRRKLADCAVVVEQRWWKLLDFAELKLSSVSFFDVQKHETAISRWSRARTRAAKLGKGLSKNGKAQKLALQHWLEAVDPRHRYGHNLQFYYVQWLHSESNEPFFYWLDLGEGKEVNLVDECPRWKLQHQCIKYLGPMERKAYEVSVEDGKLMYKETGEVVNTGDSDGGNNKWIFVLSTSKTLYVGKKNKGKFQHSSFLAGGATLAAGRIVVQNGLLKAIWPHSGHYRPTPENFQDFISFLKEYSVDVTDVKFDPVDEEEESIGKKKKKEKETKSRMHLKYFSDDNKLANIEIPSNGDFLERLKNESFRAEQETDDDDECKEEKSITKESILRRIHSHNEAKSYQLGKQLSCKWSSGVGPRIGCLRDYPSQLQSHALGQVNLSPRTCTCRLRASTPMMRQMRPCSLSPMMRPTSVVK